MYTLMPSSGGGYKPFLSDVAKSEKNILIFMQNIKYT